MIQILPPSYYRIKIISILVIQDTDITTTLILQGIDNIHPCNTYHYHPHITGYRYYHHSYITGCRYYYYPHNTGYRYYHYPHIAGYR